MRIVKCATIGHKDDKGRRVILYSAHMHPQRDVLATGGIDAQIRLWSLEQEPELISTLSLHNGAVMCVRFSPCGRWLASGSDGDNVVVVWQLSSDAQLMSNRVFGSTDVNKETWRCRIRLQKHQSDVVHLAWSANYLASCSLDGKLCVWDTELWECQRQLSAHSNFVKGVAFDPAGQYLASASDDGSVIVWDCLQDFALVKRITAPFRKEFGSVFFRRADWSPDGDTLCCVHACDDSGLVATVAVVKRGSQWREDASLVGHRFSSECAAYNPQMFKQASGEVCTLLAVGSQDGSVSLWQSNKSRAVLVIDALFDGVSIYDIGWSSDGTLLYCVGGDGAVAMVALDGGDRHVAGSLPFRATTTRQQTRQLNVSPPSAGMRTPFGTIVDSSVIVAKLKAIKVAESGAGPGGQADLIDIHPEMLAVKRKLVEDVVDVAVAEDVSMADAQPAQPKLPGRFASLMDNGSSVFQPKQSGEALAVKKQPVTLLQQQVTVGKDGKRRVAPSVVSSSQQSSNDQRSGFIASQPRAIQQQVMVKRLVADTPAKLPVPELKAKLVIEHGSVRCTAEQPAMRGISRLTYTATTKSASWSTHVPAPVLTLIITPQHVITCTQACTVFVWSRGGRKVLPVIKMDSHASLVESTDSHLACITTRGALWLWTYAGRCVVDGASLAYLLKSPDVLISRLHVSNNGTVTIVLSDYTAYAYDCSLSAWVLVKDHADFERLSHVKVDPLPHQDAVVTGQDVSTYFRDAQSAHFRSADVRVSVNASKLEDAMHVSLIHNDANGYQRALQDYCTLLAQIGEAGVSRAVELKKLLCDDGEYQRRLNSAKLDGREVFLTLLPLLAKSVRLQHVLSDCV